MTSTSPSLELTKLVLRSVSSVVELISKKPIPPYVKNITLEIMAEDDNEEDVEVSRTALNNNFS